MFLSFLSSLLHVLTAGLFGYISGTNVFPQPLNEAEEREALERWEAGDITARDLLIERNLRLVAHIAKKFETTGEDADDLISIGTIGLIKGITGFRRDRNTKLSTYAARCVENEILMYLRATKKNRRDLLLFDSIGSDKEGNEITLLDVLDTGGAETVSEEVEVVLECEELLKRLTCLTPREKRVIVMRYGLLGKEIMTQREIGKQLKISRSYVSRIEKRALEKLQQEFSKERAEKEKAGIINK